MPEVVFNHPGQQFVDSCLRTTKVLGQFSLCFALNKAKKCQLPQIHPWRNPLNLVISFNGEWFVYDRTAGAILSFENHPSSQSGFRLRLGHAQECTHSLSLGLHVNLNNFEMKNGNLRTKTMLIIRLKKNLSYKQS